MYPNPRRSFADRRHPKSVALAWLPVNFGLGRVCPRGGMGTDLDAGTGGFARTADLNATPDSEVSIRAGSIPLTTGRMGRKGQHIAVRVEGPVNPEVATRLKGPR